jgi:Undecaprenyl-phosphate glucose phosphotransferase
MPGMAEPNIAIDIVASTRGMSGRHDNPALAFRPRPSLAARTLGLIALDIAVTAIAAIACFSLFNPPRSLTAPSVVLAMACLTVCVGLSFCERGLYSPSDVLSRDLNGRRLALAWVQAVAVGTLLTFCLASIPPQTGMSQTLGGMTTILAGPWVPALLVAGFLALVTARLVRIRVHAGPAPLNRTVIIGDHDSIQDLLIRFDGGSRRGFDIVGVVEHDIPAAAVQPAMARHSFRGLPILGDIDGLEHMIRHDAVDTVLVALPWSAGAQVQAIIRRISMAPIDVYIYTGINSLNLPLRQSAVSSDLPLLMACNRPINGWRASIKRAEDIVLSAGLLLFISPVMLIIAFAIKFTSKGPVLFRQRRTGYNNHVIQVLKFRSMYTHLSDADAAQQACRGDKRVTPVGAWLRKTSLDELPQLLNVLKGEMSLVGPRPHALATTAGGLALEDAVPVYSSRHRVKPGITGWAQVNGYRGALDSVEKIVHRVNHDLYYIEHWSLAFDIKILWQTVKLVFADDNAF